MRFVIPSTIATSPSDLPASAHARRGYVGLLPLAAAAVRSGSRLHLAPSNLPGALHEFFPWRSRGARPRPTTLMHPGRQHLIAAPGTRRRPSGMVPFVDDRDSAVLQPVEPRERPAARGQCVYLERVRAEIHPVRQRRGIAPLLAGLDCHPWDRLEHHAAELSRPSRLRLYCRRRHLPMYSRWPTRCRTS